MDYIRKDFKGYNFPHEYLQCFQNKFFANAAMEKEIVRKKMNGDINDRDVSMAAFVYEHVVASVPTLEIVCNVKPSERDSFQKRLDKLVLFRVLNRFMLCTDEKNRDFPSDAMYFYTLDMGGKFLLEHYWRSNVDLWNTGTAGLCAEKVSRLLISGDFHAKLLESCPQKLTEFKCRKYRIGRDVADLSFEFSLQKEQDGVVYKRYFIGDVVKEYDWDVDLRDRIEILNSICSTKIWQRFWPTSENAPLVLFIVENDARLNDLMLALQMYKIPQYLVTTEERLEKGLNHISGVWKKYDDTIMGPAEAKTKMFID